MGPNEANRRGVVEVVFAMPEKQVMVELEATAGLTVGRAIELSAIARRFPGVDLDALEVGIWGRVVSREQPVGAGDRVEIYRPLVMDPREARRRRAGQGG
jgi:putative ubiquitin-RnfH superfamily antitoxin RatB of RatAB toxin-antitoxin module